MSTGKNFENKITKWHKGVDCFTRRLPDFANSGKTQYAIADRVTVTKIGAFFFEMKHTNSKTSFSFRLIKPHQWRAMLDLESQQPRYVRFLIEDGKHNVYMVPPHFLWNFKHNGLKSVKFSDIDSWIVTCEGFQRYITYI